MEVVGEAGGGLVKSLAHKGFRNIEIDESILIPSEKQVIEDLLLAAIKIIKLKAKKPQKEMAKMGQAFGLPEALSCPSKMIGGHVKEGQSDLGH